MNINLSLKKGLAYATIDSHGLDPDSYKVFITHSFSNITQIIPHPKGDSFSSSMGVFLAGKNDTVCLFTQPPGLIKWRKKHSNPKINILELNPRLGPKNIKGYPYGSINNALIETSIVHSKIIKAKKQPVLITTFSDQKTRKKANSAGLNMIQSADPILVNSKILFHKLSKKFKYKTCSAYIVQKEKDIELVVKMLPDSKYGAWVKSDGSGGDTVVYVSKITKNSIKSAIKEIHYTILDSLRDTGLTDAEKGRIIKTKSLIPNSGIVVESDVRNYGEVIINGSNIVSTNKNGKIELLGLYSQITNNGAFCGSRNLFDDSDLQQFLLDKKISQKQILELLKENAHSVAKAMLNLDYFGIHGQDFFVVYTSNNELKIFNTEINARISNSGVAHMAAMKVGVSHFLMLNIRKKNGYCNTLDDFKKMATFGSVDYLNNPPQDGAIWPMAFKAMWKKVKDDHVLIEPSEFVRVLILGDNSQTIDEISKKLNTRCDFV